MHAERLKAKQEYDAAIIRLRRAENVSEAAYVAADADLAVARTRLVAMELSHPTSNENRKRDAELRIRNRGWGM